MPIILGPVGPSPIATCMFELTEEAKGISTGTDKGASDTEETKPRLFDGMFPLQ